MICMTGSSESHTVYFYSRVSKPLSITTRRKRSVAYIEPVIVVLPFGRDGLSEEVLCDPCFSIAINMAVAQTAQLKKHVLQLVESQPKMVTRPR